jgi:FtsH-binding integral membrane protein
MADGGKAWQWPGQWVKQESFWRDVGSRTLSALLAAFFLYMIASSAGIVASPPFLRVLIAVGLTAISTLITYGIMRLYVRRQRRKPVKPGSWGRFFAELLTALTIGMSVYFVTFSMFQFLANRIDWLGHVADFYSNP